MRCYFCQAEEGLVEVEEVWFDLGEPIMRLASTEDWDNKPCVCKPCRSGAHELASTVLMIQSQAGALGPLWPTRWWVRFADGQVVGGDVTQRDLGRSRPPRGQA